MQVMISKATSLRALEVGGCRKCRSRAQNFMVGSAVRLRGAVLPDLEC